MAGEVNGLAGNPVEYCVRYWRQCTLQDGANHRTQSCPFHLFSPISSASIHLFPLKLERILHEGGGRRLSLLQQPSTIVLAELFGVLGSSFTGSASITTYARRSEVSQASLIWICDFWNAVWPVNFCQWQSSPGFD